MKPPKVDLTTQISVYRDMNYELKDSTNCFCLRITSYVCLECINQKLRHVSASWDPGVVATMVVDVRVGLLRQVRTLGVLEGKYYACIQKYQLLKDSMSENLNGII